LDFEIGSTHHSWYRNIFRKLSNKHYECRKEEEDLSTIEIFNVWRKVIGWFDLTLDDQMEWRGDDHDEDADAIDNGNDDDCTDSDLESDNDIDDDGNVFSELCHDHA
jgi:hypothetical protein